MVPPNADQSGLKAHESSGECEEGTGKSYEVSLLVMGPIPQWWAVVDSRIPAFLANAEKALAVPSRLESPSPSCNILQHLATSCNILQSRVTRSPFLPFMHWTQLWIGDAKRVPRSSWEAEDDDHVSTFGTSEPQANHRRSCLAPPHDQLIMLIPMTKPILASFLRNMSETGKVQPKKIEK